MRIIELLIDEDALFSGIEAISIVDKPAIEEHFIALKEQTKVKLAEVDKEKRILMGAALVPNKNIYRTDGEDEYYIYFSEDTVRKASELFLMRGKQNKSTLEHEAELNGLSVVESWIVEDEVHDKSRKYDLDMPVGTWMVSMKVNNQEVWENYVKTGLVKGFSIEGYFTDKIEMSDIKNGINESDATEILFEIQDFIESIKGDDIAKKEYKIKAKSRVLLKKKSDEFNKKHKSKLGYGVSSSVLSSVYQRGLGAYNTSHSPKVRSASQWGFARVNAFLYLVKNGRPQNSKYTTDYDLLPKKHPKSSKS